jgi:hypothetical protein
MYGSGLAHAVNVALLCVKAVLAVIALTLLGKKHAWGLYKSLVAILIVMLWVAAIGLIVQFYHPTNRHLFYVVYFYSYWSSSIVEAILLLVFCYGILTGLFSSIPKLRSISTFVFWWIVLTWCVMSAMNLGPHVTGRRLLVAEATQLMRLAMVVSFLTAMAVFVCIRPFGLRLRSSLPAFGFGLALSAMAVFLSTVNIVSRQQFYKNQMFAGIAIFAQLVCWVAAIYWFDRSRQIVSV